MQALPRDIGWLEVICGPMFSGKTEELIRRLRRAVFARQRVQIFKPRIDTRYRADHICSHSQQQLEAQQVAHAGEIRAAVATSTAVVAIDEAQFFDRDLLEVTATLAQSGRRVLVAGLDLDFLGVPFEPMPELMAAAEFVTKMLAICVVCGNPAGRSQRLTRQSRRVLVGATHDYEARCRRCHSREPSPPEPELFVPRVAAQPSPSHPTAASSGSKKAPL